MTVHQLETEMPAGEINEWVAHWTLLNAENKRARKKAEQKQKARRRR